MSAWSPHKLVHSIFARPGEFEFAAENSLMDNDRLPPKRRVTHVHMVCEICRNDVEVLADVAIARARDFDLHACKPPEDWPAREETESTRVSPAERRAQRER